MYETQNRYLIIFTVEPIFIYILRRLNSQHEQSDLKKKNESHYFFIYELLLQKNTINFDDKIQVFLYEYFTTEMF